MMKIGDIGEFGLIERMAEHFSADASGLVTGIGDDAAVLDGGEGRYLLLTTDMLLEEVHFRTDQISPRQLGMKTVAVNISDIAAMGGSPKWMLLSLGLPEETAVDYVDQFSVGASKMANRYGVTLIGGDTTASPKGVVVNAVVVGEVAKEELLLRKGAGEGDQLFVTGTVGDSAAGYRCLSGRCGEEAGGEAFNQLVLRHLSPEPRVKEARYLAGRKLATSMIDLSDGLAQDLGHLCRASGVGAKIWFDRVPLSEQFNRLSEAGAFEVETALTGGEDYELLFTVPIEKVEALDRLEKELGCRVTHIGEICKDEGVTVFDSNNQPVSFQRDGYEHFRSAY